MATWTMAEAKKDFERGLFTGYQIEDATEMLSTVQLWSVAFSVKLGEGGALIDAREKKPRQFRTVDAVVAALRQVGFQVQQLNGR